MVVLKNFTGFETGGLEEAESTSGSPSIQEATVRTGDYTLELAGAVTPAVYGLRAGPLSATQGFPLIGFAFRTNDPTPTADVDFLVAWNTGDGGAHFRLRLKTSGDVKVVDADGTEVATITAPFSADTFHFIEVRWRDNETLGQIWIYIDGESKLWNPGEFDFRPGATTWADDDEYRFQGGATSGEDIYVDDVYCLSGTTGIISDRLGATEVFRYQADTASATPDTGDDIDYGSSTLYWQEVGTTPGDADEIGYAAYPTTGAVYTDDVASGKHYRHGPHGDANIDGTIKGAKWLHQLKGGGAGDYYKRYGNDGDGLTDEVATLTTAYVSYMTVSELATVVPLSTEHFAIGFKNLDLRKDLFCKGMWAFILHVPSEGPEQYYKSFGETASMSAAFAKGLTLAATVFAETHSHSESVVKTMFNPFGETTNLAESLARLSGKAFSETASLAEGIVRKVGLGISEAAGTAEALVKMVPRIFTETASMTELLARLRTKIFSEAVDMGESVIRTVGHHLAEAASLAESHAAAATFRRAFAETMSVAESLARLPGKVFSETADLSESLIRLLGKVFAETASLGEAVVRKVGVFVAETANLSEAFEKSVGQITKVFEETMSLAEGFAVKVGVSLGESMNMAEAIVRGIGQQIAETANLVESFAPAATFRKVLAETKSLAEALSRKLALSQVFAEATPLAESLVRVPGKAFAEATSLAEALVRKVSKGIAETASMTEALVRGRFKSFTETLSGLVEALGTVFIPGGGPPAVLRKLAYYAVSLLPSRTRRRGRK